jgi:sugar-specific transcriptional regulator TrmB
MILRQARREPAAAAIAKRSPVAAPSVYRILEAGQ